MITNSKLSILAIILISGLQLSGTTDKQPLFFTMHDEWQKAIHSREIFTFQGTDSLTHHSVNLLSSAKGDPLLFFSDIQTPVCADGECKLANIKVYWNLLGNYVGYGIHQNYPLTKYDHDLFDRSDYEKLHHLFLDYNSILRRRKISDLVDRVPSNTYKQGLGTVDGLSGATKKEIKESVVDGGLYSCYTLWHLIHGKAKERMKNYLKSIYSESLNNYFLYSEYDDYRAFGLKQLDKPAFGRHADQIILIFGSSSPLIRTFILKKMPDSVLRNNVVTQKIFRPFSEMDVNTKTQLIKKMGSAHPLAIEFLSEHLISMTKNQLKLYLEFVKENPELQNTAITANLIEVSRSESYPYAYVVKAYFEER